MKTRQHRQQSIAGRGLLLLLLALAAPPGGVTAQQAADGQPCRLAITGSTEPECLHEYKTAVVDEYPDCLVACRRSTVTYTAHAASGTTAGGVAWAVSGDSVHTVAGRTVTVTWGDGSWGTLAASAVGPDGDTCRLTRRVRLIEAPTVGAVTVPPYAVNAYGEKVIRVCPGGEVSFLDRSDVGNGDIAGVLWEWEQGTDATAGFTLGDIQAPAKVTHRVYNNCGCLDEEVFFVEVEQGKALDLKCYGTACENATVTYAANNPPCGDYWWHVEGGTLVGGQHTPEPTVVWDHPADGYGVLSLDGARCGEDVCPTLMSARVPVLHGGIAVEGPEGLCVGEEGLFSLPLFGSTAYTWAVSPAAGVDMTMVNNSHEARLTFTAPGTYEVRTTYVCGFLGCGPYASAPLTVTVRPALAIAGDEEVCVANAARLATVPAVAATWEVRDAAGTLVATVPAADSLSCTFPAPGLYTVTATHPDHCLPAVATVAVRDVPPPPTMDDLSPDDPANACIMRGITLHGTPAGQGWELLWHPVGPSATPRWHMGDSVSVHYGLQVCDVSVFHYDRRLGCRSADSLVRPVGTAAILPLGIPQFLSACPGSLIRWGTDVVPDQREDGVLYEWKIDPVQQYCASIQGDPFGPGATLSIHDFATPPVGFHVILVRSLCGSVAVDTIFIQLSGSHPGAPLHIDAPGAVCRGQADTLTASGGNPATYRWSVEGHGFGGNPATHTFSRSGTVDVTLYSHPYDYCTNRQYFSSVHRTVQVVDPPGYLTLEHDEVNDVLSVGPSVPAGCTFEWSHYASCKVGAALVYTGFGGPSITSPEEGNYSCVVTNAAGCSVSLGECVVDPMLRCKAYQKVPVSATYDVCSRTITATASGYSNSQLAWYLNGKSGAITPVNLYSGTAKATVDDVGTYHVGVTGLTSLCSRGSATVQVDFVPRFELDYACDSVVIYNRSRSTTPGLPVHLKVTGPGGYTYAFQFPAYTTRHAFRPPTPGGTYTVTLTQYGSTAASCALGSVTTATPLASATVVSENPYLPGYTCDNTPIRLTASTTPPRAVRSVHWDFNDSSTYDTVGPSIKHTFGGDGQYSVTATLTDSLGCRVTSDTLKLISIKDTVFILVPVTNAEPLQQLAQPVCPGTASELTFSPNVSAHYLWQEPNGTISSSDTNVYDALYAGTYTVHVVTDKFCQKKASTYAVFLNPSVADIQAAVPAGCAGQPVTLCGDNGPAAGLSYLWDITGPYGFHLTPTSPNATFTPPNPGTYAVTLTVGNGDCAALGSTTLAVNPVPAPPTIAFSGSPCIQDAPVRLDAWNFSGDLFWSNGNRGQRAYFYYPGPVEAWYLDTALGCPSQKAQLHIDRQLDFDALLTGCYSRCQAFFPYKLPVYGLSDPSQWVKWQWDLSGSTQAMGNDYYYFSPLELPLGGYGDYSLSADYAGGCPGTSPQLAIDPLEYCPCDSLTISIQRTWKVVDCRLWWIVDIDFCNNSPSSFYCLGDLQPHPHPDNIAIHTMDYDPYMALGPGGCQHMHLEIEMRTLRPSAVTFAGHYPPECGCTVEFTVDLDPGSIACSNNTSLGYFDLRPDLTSRAAACYQFILWNTAAESVLQIESSPAMVLDWNYDGIDKADGLCLFDVGLLARLADEDSVVCLTALTCQNGTLCRNTFCIPAKDLYTMMFDYGILGSAPGQAAKLVPTPVRGAPTLLPNPASGWVAVTGYAGSVVEVRLLDVNGRTVASFHDTDNFGVEGLAAGVYIVRVATRADDDAPLEVHYLKLVKE